MHRAKPVITPRQRRGFCRFATRVAFARISVRPALAFVVAWLLLCGPARAALTGVLATGKGDQFWLLRTEVGDDKSVATVVRRLADPVAGEWVQSVRLGGKILDATPLAERLAVLTDDGGWRLVWDGGTVPGTPPPDGMKLRQITSFGDTLWALAETPGARPALLRWTEAAGWAVVGPLPDGIDLAHATVDAGAEVAWVAWADHETVRVARRDIRGPFPAAPATAPATSPAARVDAGLGSRPWIEPIRPLARGTAATFVAGAPRPLLAVRTLDGRVTLWRPDALPPTPARLPMAVPADADFAVVGPTLRVVSVQDGHVQQTVVDDYGRGTALGPDPIPDPLPPPRPRGEWLNLAVLTVLTLFMIRSLRSDPANVPTLAPGLRPAPPWRRVIAAAIDASPLLAAVAWAFSRFEGTPEQLRDTPITIYLPIFLGLMAYVAHVMVAELKYGTSIGKRLLALRVISVDGTRPTAERVVLRNVLRVVEIALPPLALMPLLTPAGQRLGDLAAKTLVVANDTTVEPTPEPEA